MIEIPNLPIRCSEFCRRCRASSCANRRRITSNSSRLSHLLQTVQRAAHSATSPVEHMGINHRRRHVLVTEKFLHRANIVTIFQQVRGKRVPEGMAGDAFGQPGTARGLRHGSANGRFMRVVPLPNAAPRVHRQVARWEHVPPAPLGVGICGATSLLGVVRSTQSWLPPFSPLRIGLPHPRGESPCLAPCV